MSARTSDLVASLVRKIPRTAEVITCDPGERTPRMVMHRVLRLHQDHHARRLQSGHQGVGDGGGETFLELQTGRSRAHQPHHLRQAGDLAVLGGDVGHVDHPEEGDEVVLAHGMEVDVAHQHHLLMAVRGHGHDYRGQVVGVGGDDLAEHVGHATGRADQALALRVFPDPLEKQTDGLLDLVAVHGPEPSLRLCP